MATDARKLDPGLPPEEARSDLRDLATWCPIPLSWTVIDPFEHDLEALLDG